MHRSLPWILAIGLGLCAIDATAQLPEPGSPECTGSLAEGMSTALDEYVVALQSLVRSAPQAPPTRDDIVDLLQMARDVRTEWMKIKAQVAKQHSRLETRIDERVAFFQFYAPTIVFPNFDQFGIDLEDISRAYAAVPRGYLEQMGNRMSKERNFVFPESPITFDDLESMIKGRAALWAGAGETCLFELRQDLDKLCKRTPD